MFERLAGLLSGVMPAPDSLLDAAIPVVEQHIAPLFAEVRSVLLSRVTGDPPPTFAARLNERGIAVDEESAKVLWSVVIAAIADAPAEVKASDAAA